MPICMNALAHMPLRDPRGQGQLLQERSVQLRLIEAYSYASGDLNWRLIDVEPLMLLDLFDAVAQVGVRHENVEYQVLHVFGKRVRQLEVCFQDLLVETLSVLVLER